MPNAQSELRVAKKGARCVCARARLGYEPKVRVKKLAQFIYGSVYSLHVIDCDMATARCVYAWTHKLISGLELDQWSGMTMGLLHLNRSPAWVSSSGLYHP